MSAKKPNMCTDPVCIGIWLGAPASRMRQDSTVRVEEFAWQCSAVDCARSKDVHFDASGGFE
ncbi:hypothetical protein L917_21740 [Phytophthora nicotianae]|uniref:Uncharacterized protein n=2 Tax=Phytophthora nicotianae TaxID=4792 RepID=W2JYR4_PHYNI|nr:hypothetical protein L917_21740 [Phytophthora nicotianae]